MATNKRGSIYLLDRTLKIDVYFDAEDCQFSDNICLSICEECVDDEKIFIADETNMYLSEEQASNLAEALLEAINKSKSAVRNTK